jgi:hypothetical protein
MYALSLHQNSTHPTRQACHNTGACYSHFYIHTVTPTTQATRSAQAAPRYIRLFDSVMTMALPCLMAPNNCGPARARTGDRCPRNHFQIRTVLHAATQARVLHHIPQASRKNLCLGCVQHLRPGNPTIVCLTTLRDMPHAADARRRPCLPKLVHVDLQVPHPSAITRSTVRPC